MATERGTGCNTGMPWKRNMKAVLAPHKALKYGSWQRVQGSEPATADQLLKSDAWRISWRGAGGGAPPPAGEKLSRGVGAPAWA